MKIEITEQQVIETLKQALKIREVLGGFFSLDIMGYSCGGERIELRFFHIEKQKLIENKIKLNLPKLTKEFSDGKENLVAINGRIKISFLETGQCEITGYKETIIPATKRTVKKVPIWKCQ